MNSRFCPFCDFTIFTLETLTNSKTAPVSAAMPISRSIFSWSPKKKKSKEEEAATHVFTIDSSDYSSVTVIAVDKVRISSESLEIPKRTPRQNFREFTRGRKLPICITDCLPSSLTPPVCLMRDVVNFALGLSKIFI